MNIIRRWLFRVKIGFSYLLVKLKFLQALLPKSIQSRCEDRFGYNRVSEPIKKQEEAYAN